MILDIVVGARPNFVKAAAIIKAAEKFPRVAVRLLHTGQHGLAISEQYFRDLELPQTYRYLGIDGPDTSIRLGRMIEELGRFWNGLRDEERPNYVMVVGDADSTLAGALAAKKVGLPLVHVEAGLRCGDMHMQEELNRRAVDSISDLMYTTTEQSRDILIAEQHLPYNVVNVGNVMVDTLRRFLPKAIQTYPTHRPSYGMLTVHRAENVYDQEKIAEIMDAVREISENDTRIIFPTHPRQHVDITGTHIERVPPMGYLEFIATLARAKFVITDSGGVQEESTILGVPCITIRDSTERPETVNFGTNVVVGTDGGKILAAVQNRDRTMVKQPPILWDGFAAERILKDLSERTCVASL
jgi:UDP-N-acetylglucosamine 2-epimerase (non-hydrolysing)